MSEEERKSYEILYGKIMFVDKYRFLKPHWIKFHNYTEKLQKEIEEKTTIILVGAEKVKSLQKENEELRVQGSIILLDYNILKDKIRELFKGLYTIEESKVAKIKTIDSDKAFKFVKAVEKLLEEE